MNRQGNTILVAMSGGVDSSVAAYLLQEDGYNPIGVTFRFWRHEGADHTDEIIQQAQKICKTLGIGHRVVDLENEFKETVVEQFVEDYLSGITPNPCVFCNRQIKWRHLLKLADEIGAPLVATGHYVRIEKNDFTGRFEIIKGVDSGKDQSYVLWQLSQDALSRTKFPLGTKYKSDIKEISDELSLPLGNQKESQDVCFLPDNDYRDFLRRYVPARIKAISKGELLDEQGNVLGCHDGFHNFTIGQRKGFKMGFSERKYVKQIDARKNQVTISGNDGLFSESMILGNVNWVSSEPREEADGIITIRYNHKGIGCKIHAVEKNRLIVEFNEAQRAVTPGQSAVLYKNDRLILGGIIQKSIEKMLK